MASPFSVFRSNLKPLMVVLTLLSLFAFVVLPAIQMYLQSNVPGQGEVVVATYNGGSFNTNEIYYYQTLLGKTNRFLAALSERVVANGGTPQVPGYRPIGDPRQGQMAYGISVVNTPQSVVRTKLYAEEAAKLGLQLDDTAIDIWMQRFTDNKLSGAEVNGLRAESSQNTLGRSQMYELLKTELMARIYSDMFFAGIATEQNWLVSPIETWQNFLKFNQQAKAVAYPVLVEEYMDETTAPSDSTVLALYEEGKDRLPTPSSSEAAFRRHYAADLEYVSATLDNFVQREIEKLSEEEIRAEYQRRLDGGDFMMPPTDLNVQPPAEEAAAPTTDPAAPESSDGTGEASADPETPAGTDTPAEETNPPAATEGEGDSPASTENAAAPPAGGTTESTEPAGEDSPAPAPGSSGSETSGGEASSQPGSDPPKEDGSNSGDGSQAAVNTDADALTFVSALQDEQSGSTESTQPPADPPAQENAAGETTPPPATEGEGAEATQDPPTEPGPSPAGQDATAESSQEGDAAGETADEGTDPVTAGETTDDPETTELEPRSFEAVRDEVARDMVLETAREEQEKALLEALNVMRTYADELALYRDLSKVDDTEVPPTRPDLRQIAESLGLDYGQTGMVDLLEVIELPIGQSRNRSGQGIATLLYDNSRPVFNVVRTSNVTMEEQTEYITWKTEARESYTPELKDIRDEVEQAARMIQARDLAAAAAKEIADKANASPETALEELVPETRRNLIFSDLGPFTWMQFFGFGNPMITQLPDLDQAGDDFMAAVFNGPANEFRVGANDPKSVFYVVKATELSPPVDELRPRFMQSNLRAVATMMSGSDLQQIQIGFQRQFEESIGLKFNQEALDN